MIAKFEGYDEEGKQIQHGVDSFTKYTIYRNIELGEVGDTPDITLYSSKSANDELCNLVYFDDKDDNLIALVQSSSVCYLMDDNGKTFEVVRMKK